MRNVIAGVLSVVVVGCGVDASEGRWGPVNDSRMNEGIYVPTDLSLGADHTYVREGTLIRDVTGGLVWEDRRVQDVTWHDAAARCADLSMRLPTRDELVRFGNWANAHADEANRLFADPLFWSSYWSSDNAAVNGPASETSGRWGVDISGTVPDSVGIPVVGCALPVPESRAGVRCVR